MGILSKEDFKIRCIDLFNSIVRIAFYIHVFLAHFITSSHGYIFLDILMLLYICVKV